VVRFHSSPTQNMDGRKTISTTARHLTEIGGGNQLEAQKIPSGFRYGFVHRLRHGEGRLSLAAIASPISKLIQSSWTPDSAASSSTTNLRSGAKMKIRHCKQQAFSATNS